MTFAHSLHAVVEHKPKKRYSVTFYLCMDTFRQIQQPRTGSLVVVSSRHRLAYQLRRLPIIIMLALDKLDPRS